MRVILFLSLLLMTQAVAALADMVVPTRTIRAHALIGPGDVTLMASEAAAGFARLQDVVGQETRVALYPGRPILVDDIGPPAIVARNQLVQVVFHGTGLSIITEGRALERGAEGDRVRIMNLDSRATVIGRVMGDGTVTVQE